MSHSLQIHVALLTEANKSSSLLLGSAHCVLSQSLGSTKSTQPTGCVRDWHQHQLQLTKPALQTPRSTSKATPRGRCSSVHVCSMCKTEVQLSSEPTHQQSWDVESSPTASLPHQVLDCWRQSQAIRCWLTSCGVIYHLCFSSTQMSPARARPASVMPFS